MSPHPDPPPQGGRGCKRCSACTIGSDHSPLEGESARPGRSPPASRWGEVWTGNRCDVDLMTRLWISDVSCPPTLTLPLKGGGDVNDVRLAQSDRITPPLRGSRRDQGAARRRAGGGCGQATDATWTLWHGYGYPTSSCPPTLTLPLKGGGDVNDVRLAHCPGPNPGSGAGFDPGVGVRGKSGATASSGYLSNASGRDYTPGCNKRRKVCRLRPMRGPYQLTILPSMR